MHDSNLPNVNMWCTYVVQSPKGTTKCKMHTVLFFTFVWCTLIVSKFFLFTNECTSDCLKNNIKIYIKIAPTRFSAVTPSAGSALFVPAKVTLVIIVNYGTSVVMWLHILVGPCWCNVHTPTRS